MVTPNITVVTLDSDPNLIHELQDILGKSLQGWCDIVLSFSSVPFIGNDHLSALLRTRKAQKDHCRKMILCDVKPEVKKIIIDHGLEKLFRIVDNKDTARAVLTAVA